VNQNQWVGSMNNPIDIEVLEESALAMAQSTIQNVIDQSRISKSDLARRMEIGRSGITRMLSGSHNLTIKTIARALAVCGREVRFEAVRFEAVKRRDAGRKVRAILPNDIRGTRRTNGYGG
jgi:transcriptional regulator with XRE-family HTH domain